MLLEPIFFLSKAVTVQNQKTYFLIKVSVILLNENNFI